MNEIGGRLGKRGTPENQVREPRWLMISHIMLMLMWMLMLLTGELNDEFQNLEDIGNLDKTSSGK